jgi:hypothetical protein
MRNAIIIFVFLLLVCVLIPQPSRATQIIPQPGQNCGVAYPPAPGSPLYKKDMPATPDLTNAEYEVYACCYSLVNDVLKPNILPEGVTNIPGLSTILKPIENLIDPWGFPGNLLPYIGEGLSIRGMITAITGLYGNEPCLPGGEFAGGEPNSDSCYCKAGAGAALRSLAGMCMRIKNDQEKRDCMNCLGYDVVGDIKKNWWETTQITRNDRSGGVWTGIGCVQTSLSGFIQETVFGLGIGLAGITALGCIIYSAILYQTSAGNSEKLQSAQELLRSCIFGLLLIIFSVFILRVIGVDLLRIPGFN